MKIYIYQKKIQNLDRYWINIQEIINLKTNIDELKEDHSETKRKCEKYLSQLIDDKKEEKNLQKKFYSEEEVENIKSILEFEKENNLKNLEYVWKKEKSIFLIIRYPWTEYL